MNLNKGIYLDDELQNTTATDFSIGVAGYPEKHIESPNINMDLKYLKQKVEAGSEYIVTQMFFDNKKYFDFVNSCRKANINIPIVPGIKPISSLKDITLLPQTFNIDIPENLAIGLMKCKTNSEARQVGVEWAIKQSKELVNFGVSGLHFYTLGSSDNLIKIAKEVF